MVLDLRKKSFIRSAENVGSNYDYLDIANGTGVVTLYPGVTETSGAKDYHLFDQTFYSSDIETAEGSFDFDLTSFNTPRTVKGTAYFSCFISNSFSICTTYG
jgi:hypothetical protein